MITDTPKISRRFFVIGTAAVGGGLALGLQHPVRWEGRPRPGRLARDQRLGGHPPRRHGRDPDRALRDGAGIAHRSRPAGGRGAGVRLGEGDHRVSDPRGERQAQARVGRFLHGRQPRHPHLARVRPQGRRHGAHDAGPGRRRRLGGAGLRVQCRQQRDHARALRPHDHVRQGGRQPRRSSPRRPTWRSRTRRTGSSSGSR